MSGLDWGSVPVWIGSLATPISVLVAYRALRRGENVRISDQASMVYIGASLQQSRLELTINNRSNAAIFHARLFALKPGDIKLSLFAVENEICSAALLAPLCSKSGDVNGPSWGFFSMGDDLVASIDLETRLNAVVIFRDVRGNRWARYYDGTLERDGVSGPAAAWNKLFRYSSRNLRNSSE